ncbi:DUF5011 domain-containing protein [Stigmatella aurantiaca]|uniref:Pesticidal crystal protein Cry22Aa Ig-like domain-containing protein n=1 Tax=Stigmatella aurantiaca (strain DW4/3-1) TaxID=378806 RepID=Q08VT4_STIAD|nr:DUF5011 domain-containing protein [Stigmatella aurantiaca]ADO70937.1 uncharacterized protein STAUR_3145 [Stigmatella aurantiaca DW4/3-1]EAU64592.1 hypothetical protein STIAU_4472 [Stigmatella aurantiaca DW4/3-1]
MKHTVWGVLVGAGAVLVGMPADAQTRSPWQMHHGLEASVANPHGLLEFSCTPTEHGDRCEYDVATIPPSEEAGWAPAPNPDTIGFSIPSRVCQAPVACLAYGDFTYFQTFVDVPANVVVTTFTIAFDGMDDGSRVTLFNSAYPDGLVIPGSYVYLRGSGTANLGAYVKPGERQRVVVTQVDDCCSDNRLQTAEVVLNGEVVELPEGCHGPSDCDDGNTCTTDVCRPDGTCEHPLLVCAGGQSCGQPPGGGEGGDGDEEDGGVIIGIQEQNACPEGATDLTMSVRGTQDMVLECGQDHWADPGAQAWDVSCNALEVHVFNSGPDGYGPGPNPCAEGTYSVQYVAWDAKGRTTSTVRSVRVEDTTPPAFRLKGPGHMTHTCGSQWVDPGWEAIDACYGNITPEVHWTGFPNGWVEGSYTVVYTLTDSGGNKAPTLTRTVDVVDCPW